MPSSVALALDAVPLGEDLRRPVDYNARLVAEAVVGTLYREAPGEPDPVPGTAVGLRPLDGGLRWRLAPDPRARWSDGVPLLPGHVVSGVRDAAAKDRQLGRFLRPGAEAAVETADGSVELRLTVPTGFLPALLTLPQLAPLRPGCDAVLGPYMPAGAEPCGGPRLVRQEHAGTEGLPDELRFPVFEDLASAVSAFRAGAVDATPTTGFGVPDALLLADDPDLMARSVSIFASLEFGKRCRRLRGAPGLRAAVARALDPVALAAHANGLLEPAPAPAAALAGLPPVDGPVPWPPDAREVRMVRAELSGDPSVEVAYADFVPNGTVVHGICAQLRRVFGLDFRPRALPYQEYVRAALRGDHSLLYTLTTADYPHPAALLAPWTGGGTYSRVTGFTDRAFDDLFRQAQETTDAAEAAPLWRRAEDRWRQLAPRVPLLRVRAHCLAAPHVREAGLTASGNFPFHLLSGPAARPSHPTPN
ncbi:hypothetical protein CGZ69_07540 [Streptomyces peucetius subsp. caesius ATCC 27952]|nr:hypothetical protein CGZ69_07540 [Streptomyces peucetius subsp. caesius ATCC 27952]